MITRLDNFIAHMKRARKYKSIFHQLVDLVHHKIKINTNPSDYYRFGFYKGDKTWAEKSRYIGEWDSMYWPYENNELKYNIIFTDKYIQKNILKGMMLPTPELITTVGETRAIRNFSQLSDFLDHVDTDIVVKPISGTGGSGILVLSRNNGDFISGRFKYTKEDIWNHVNSNFERGYLVEKRVFNPKPISCLNPLALNTFRVVTIKTADHHWHIANTCLKVAQGDCVVDNVGAGGITLLFDSNGHSYTAMEPANHETIEHHPDTNRPLIGVHIKEYHEINALALKACENFSFLGTIGWDIAATLDGPMIIEGNLLWGMETQITTGGLVTDKIASGLRKRSLLTEWDKTKMYPGFNRK